MFCSLKISNRISKRKHFSRFYRGCVTNAKDDLRYQIWIAEKHEIEAPPFPAKYEWFNVKTPLSFTHELRGKLVVVDFFTYCCINCLHILPDLHFLKEKYKNFPAVEFIGIHSPKFNAEKDSRNLRNALLKYNIDHPVVNDVDKTLWQNYGAKVWPSQFVIAPTGNIIFKHLGEGGRESLDQVLEAALEYYKDQLDNSHIQIALEREKYPNLTSPLRFPGKIAIDKQRKRLFISDTGNNRIIVTDLKGKFITQIGSTNGFYDGSFDTCAFRGVQGLHFDEMKNQLYVADTDNHAIRSVNFDSKQVTTIVGNGVRGNDLEGGQIGRLQSISSPWDITISPKFPNSLYIAMAGSHQIWQHNLSDGTTVRVAGNGREMNLNNKVKPINAAFAQPSGITFNSKNQLFIADSESSSIRMVDFEESWTSTIVGGDANRPDNLFVFGDVDAEVQNARLQHPLGVTALPSDKIAVADTYNHKIKVVDPTKKAIQTMIGNGHSGFKDGDVNQAMLYEPSGLCYFDEKLYIADTNNCAVRVLDLQKMILETIDCASVPYNKSV